MKKVLVNLKDKNKIIIDPEIRSGQPIIKGTRLTTYDVLSFMIEFVKDNEEEFRANYADVSVSQIVSAINYFINN